MNIKEFVNIATRQDKRNIFESYSGNIESIPFELKEFFKKYNPVDVEVIMNGNSIHFFPAEKLDILQKEYDLGNDNFIFATCNADPIFYNSDGIFSCYHGDKNPKFEKITSSFEMFLNMIDITI